MTLLSFTHAAFHSLTTARRRRRTIAPFAAAAGQRLPSSTPPRGIIFDMDGTLVRPCIDFGEMRRRIYHVSSQDLKRNVTQGCVLELSSSLSPPAQEKAARIFEEIEERAIRDMQLTDGLLDLVEWLDQVGMKRAVLTRNVERSIAALHDKMHPAAPFYPAVARNSICHISQQSIPPKPQPDAIHFICDKWDCDPSQVIMVGDSSKDDVVAANRAGCASVLLSLDEDNCSGNESDSTLEEREPTLTVKSLQELHEILLSQYAPQQSTRG
jgi:HAD superfamily hydrolase (TIGR01549 family)